MDSQDREPAVTLNNRFMLRRKLGSGAFGVVHEAVDTATSDKVVAVKILKRAEEDDRERFRREVAALAAIRHPNVVEVADQGVDPDGNPYYAMEFLEGEDLLARVERQHPLPVVDVVDIFLQVCDAMDECHRLGVVHRDLKPSNVFLVGPASHTVKVIDFGFAKARDAERITKQGQIPGTLGYLSPERLGGTDGPKGDQYAIAASLYRCLTRHLPFEGADDQTLVVAIMQGRCVPPREYRPDIPAELETIVLRAMHPSPEERYSNVRELGDALSRFASAGGQTRWKEHHPPNVARAAVPARGRTRRLVIVSAAVALSALGIIFVGRFLSFLAR
jgi:serine/threonine-protein kinase